MSTTAFPLAPLLTELQAAGLRLDQSAATGVRRGGAGPSDHQALVLGGATLMVPVLSDGAQRSPFRLRVLKGDRDGTSRTVVERDGVPLPELEVAVPRPARFYEFTTAEGIPYAKIALLHAGKVLASTVLQTCVRYVDPASACQFCAIGDSLAGGRTIVRKTPAQLAEVAEAAVRLDGVEQVVLTTGTPATPDRGAAHLAACTAAIKARVNIPVQVQCEPPEDPDWYRRLHAAGVDSLGLHLEAVEPAVRARIMPGKAQVPVSAYLDAFRAAVAVFGRGQVSTYLIVGLGDAPASITAIAEQVAALGVYPFVVPFVPLAGTPLANHPTPSASTMSAIYREVAASLRRHGLSSADMSAGCAKCGACSALASYETPEASDEAPGQAHHQGNVA